MSKKNKFYAYLLTDSNVSGVLNSWDLCKSLVAGKKARYKSFDTLEEANSWLINGAKYESHGEKNVVKNKFILDMKNRLEEGIYFDAGTGRGQGVEVRVTNLKGFSYLNEHFKERVNEFGNINLGKEVTNNYGELSGLYCALVIARRENIYKIFGDSQLVIYYWSERRGSLSTLPSKTVKLIEEVARLAKEFREKGGKIEFVSGDINPADLGFHK